MKYKAVIIGGSGAVGSNILNRLFSSESCESVISLGRKSLDLSKYIGNTNKCIQQTVDFENISANKELLSGIDAAFCTLGVGQPSKVSKEEFWKVDVEYASSFASLCAEAGVRYFSLLSAVDANPDSQVHYLKAKGIVQERIIHAGFKGVYIFQPSLLVTDEDRYGFGQKITQITFPFISPFLPSRYHQIHVRDLGNAMSNRTETAISNKEVGVVEILTYKDFLKHNKA
jgi:uncharacterized protein YbjT (DUF2867 family)